MASTEIRLATSPDDRYQVYRLRYDTYIGELQLDLQDIDHDQRIIRTPLDEQAQILAAFDGATVVGTVTVYCATLGLGAYADLFEMSRFSSYYPSAVSMTSKLVVRQAFRLDPEENIVLRLTVAAFQVFIKSGIRFDNIFFDTGYGRREDFPRLKSLYEHLGYRQVMPNVVLSGYGECHRMILVVRDKDHLTRVSSPLAKYVPVEKTDESVEFFYKYIVSNPMNDSVGR